MISIRRVPIDKTEPTTISRLGSNRLRKSRGFTFFELLAVATLIAIIFAVAALGINAARSRLSNAAYQLTQDIQTLYNDSIRTGRVLRLAINEARDGYSLEVFELPRPKPKADDRAGLEKWEKEQIEIEDALRQKDKFSITRLDRGLFRAQKKRTLSSSIKIRTFLTDQNLKDDDPHAKVSLLFYPFGETQPALIVLADTSDKVYSLEVHPLSGRVKITPGEITKDQWMKNFSIK
jgi:prepilin-type N-terminal cleavage/methylation domain-containing protein